VSCLWLSRNAGGARIEKKLGSHDLAIASLIDTLRRLMTPPDLPTLPIGFITSNENYDACGRKRTK
jgi:hypothetical protein